MTSDELVKLFKKVGYDDEITDYILSKNIKHILKRNPEELEDLLNVIKKENIDIKKCLTLLSRGKAQNVEKIIEVLKSEKININKSIDVLIYGKIEEIKDILKILRREHIKVNKSLCILAHGKASEMEKIIKLLRDEAIDIRKCPSILIRSKASEIEEIIKLLKGKNININDCPSILTRGKAHEIERIITLLEKEKIEIDKCLTVLARGKYENIERIIKFLKEKGIELEKLNQFSIGIVLLKDYEYIHNLISLTKDFYSDDDVKIYVKLKYTFNKFYNKEEIEEICNELNIDILRFLDIFLSKNSYVKDNMIEELNAGGKLWIGKHFPCTKQQLEDNKELIIEFCRSAAIYFAKKHDDYYYLIDDMTGFVLDIVMNKCGAFFYEYSNEKDA